MANNSNNARKYKNSKNLKQFPPILKDISVLPTKKKSIKSYYNTKDGEKRLTPNADYATHTQSQYNTIACCPKLRASMYLPIRHNEVGKSIYENLRETKVPMNSIQGVYLHDDKEI